MPGSTLIWFNEKILCRRFAFLRVNREDDVTAAVLLPMIPNEFSHRFEHRLWRLSLLLLEQFQILPEDLDHLDAKHFGVIEREGKKLYRYRAKDYRIYFEQRPEGITIHRVLNKNTFRDFLFRSKLPVAEDQQLGKTREFWKLIEQGEKTRKA